MKNQQSPPPDHVVWMQTTNFQEQRISEYRTDYVEIKVAVLCLCACVSRHF